MRHIDLLDDIIQNINPDEVPLEYIVLARVVDFRGNERIIEGPEIARVMRGPERKTLSEARVVLDVRKIRMTIARGVNEIYDAINKLVEEEEAKKERDAAEAIVRAAVEAMQNPDAPKDTDN